ncbi:DNA-methyltransferase [Chloroflexota bacterium]
MADKKQGELGDELFGSRLGELRDATGPIKGEFVSPPEESDKDEIAEALPEQEEFWRPPARFGSIPVEANPLGWDSRRGFHKLYPQVMLPTQVVERVSFGHQELEPNRLFWGDNLHVMRQLPSESIDLIYIDPPFFSGKQYNVIFGDQNELRSFSDIWEAGLPGYLVWLNARLYEMKRLLKKTGSIYVHLDWHAAHYVKQEMDKIFGYNNFHCNIVWCYKTRQFSKKYWNRKHDDILFYTKTPEYVFKWDAEGVLEPYDQNTIKKYKFRDDNGYYRLCGRGIKGSPIQSAKDVDPVWEETHPELVVRNYLGHGYAPSDYFLMDIVNQVANERIGYPTQKPEKLLEKFIMASSKPGDTVADFFCGGGTTPAVAQRLGRRWIACDQSRVAIAITADRVSKQVEQITLEQASKSFVVPDFTVEHWGIYEAKRLSETPPDQFRQFVLRAYGAVPDNSEAGIHGRKGAIPVWVGEPSQKVQVTAQDVVNFANAVRKTARYQQDNLRDGIMLAWAFRPDAVQAAQQLREQEATDLNFIRLDMIRIDSPQFRQHVSVLSTEDKADYNTFLTFVMPPRVEVGWKKLSGLSYRFDISESIVLNSGGKIINVQWDFDHNDTFISTKGYSFIRTSAKESLLLVDYTFPATRNYRIACKVQDDIGGEGLWTGHIEVK